MKPDLKIVPAAAPPYDAAKGKKRIEALRRQLLRAAVRHVTDGKTGALMDRVREASDLSGVPRNLIEVELKR